MASTYYYIYLLYGIILLQDSLYGLKHTFLLNKVEVFLQKLCQSAYAVKVLSPDIGCGEHAVSNLLGVASCPEFLEEVHNLLSIVWYNLCSVLTLATLVVGDDGCKTEYQSLWQLALALQVCLYAWKVAGAEFRE